MPVDTRQQRIVELVRRAGYLAIEELATHFGVTPQTIRSDLNRLAADARLIRHHGGASVPSSVSNTQYALRRTDLAREKARIAQRVARWLPPRSSVFLSLGTTTLAVAQALHRCVDLKVITNSLEAAQVLVQHPGVDVIVLGGRLERRNLGASGTTTVAAAEQYRVDVCLFSVGGIAADGTLLDFHESEVAVVRAMMQRARQRVLVVDHSKFGRTAAVRVGDLADLSALVTDASPPAAVMRRLRGLPVEVLLAGRAGSGSRAGPAPSPA